MLNDVPLSAYVLCYGPLALTIIGFVIFAAMTDGDARRTYLRRRPGAQPGVAPEITRTIHSETPAGVRVTIQPEQPVAAQPVELPPQTAPSAPQRPAPKPGNGTPRNGQSRRRR